MPQERLNKVNIAETEKALYPKSRAFLEDALPKLRQTLQENVTPETVRITQDQLEEAERALAALDRGDKEPAKELMLTGIDANVRAVRNVKTLLEAGRDVRENEGATETRGQRIAMFAELLGEMEEGPSSSEPQRRLKAENEARRTPEQMETASLERILTELNNSETSIRQALNEVQAQKKKIEGLIRQAALDKIKRSIESS